MQNPNEPFGQSPNPYNPPPSSPPPVPSGGVSLDVIGQAWQLVSANLGVWIGASAIYFVSIIIVYFLSFSTMRFDPITQQIAINPLLYVLFPAIGLLLQFLIGGMMRMAISQIRTGRADLGQLFSVGDVFVNLLISGIIVGFIVGLGSACCVIPGLIALALFSMVTPLIVDRKASFAESLTMSIDATKPHVGSLLVLFIVLFLISAVGNIFCGLGSLITFPLSVMSIALIYNSLFGGSIAPSNYPPTSNAPIADPNG